MAKKPGGGAFQVDIDNDADLEAFVNQPKMCLLDVYAEWCGPCVGMLGTLKRLKGDYGEDLQLATCKADTIEALARFRNKSEPTWLFCTSGYLFNVVFGCDIPKIRALIEQDMKKIKRRFSFVGLRPIGELLPAEQERVDRIAAEAEEERLNNERTQAIERRIYLNYVTEQILNYTAGCFGVTLFGPQVTREHIPIIKKVAEAEKLSCQDINVVTLKPEHIDTIHYDCKNKIPKDVVDLLYNKELIVMYWKCPYTEKRPIEEILTGIVRTLIKSAPAGPDGEKPPPLLPSLQIKVKPKKDTVSELNIPGLDLMMRMANEEEEEEYSEEVEEEVSENNNGESQGSLVARQSSSFLARVTIPAMWTPANARCTAAAIFVFFRNQTTAIIPPDPKPDPPHLIVAFDVWKRLDVIDVMNKYSDEILAYGYFTSEEPEKAQLIANSNSSYAKTKPDRYDKLVIKVAKRTSHAVLAFAAHGPTYVSPNVTTGSAEALQFFPPGYSNAMDVRPVATPKPQTEPQKETAAVRTSAVTGTAGSGTAEPAAA